MVSGHIQNLLWGTSFFLLSAIDSFVSPSSLVCCRNATLAAMSAIKISAEEMCFLVAENTSPSKVLASQAGQPPSQECVLSFYSPQNTLEKSSPHAMIVTWNLFWYKLIEEAHVKLHPHSEKCSPSSYIPSSVLLLTSKQREYARKTMENTQNSKKPVQKDTNCLTLDPWW